MTQQLTDDRQAKTTTGTEACICVAEIMKAHPLKPSAFSRRLPWTLEISILGVVTRHYIRAKPFKCGQYRKRRSIEDYAAAWSKVGKHFRVKPSQANRGIRAGR
jgi:hypothetical protein